MIHAKVERCRPGRRLRPHSGRGWLQFALVRHGGGNTLETVNPSRPVSAAAPMPPLRLGAGIHLAKHNPVEGRRAIGRMMKIVACLLSLLPAFACAVGVEGSYFRFSADGLVIARVAVGGPEWLNQHSGTLRAVRLDYWLQLGAARVFVREGDVNLIDPESMDAVIDFSHQEEKDGFRILTMVCRDKEEMAAAVMITALTGIGVEPKAICPGIYFSVRGADYRLLQEGLENLVLKLELRLKTLVDCQRLGESDLASAIQPLVEFVKGRANRP